MAIPFLSQLFASRALPQAVGADTNPVNQRADRFGDTYVNSRVPTRHIIADEGAYFSATNPTIGTGIQLAANVTSFSDTNGIFVLQNTDGVGGKRCYLDYVRLWVSGTAPTATTNMFFMVRTDTINRVPTTAANRTLLTANNGNMDSGTAAVTNAFSFANAGAMTVPASSSSSRVAARSMIATSLGITGDQYTVQFGTVDQQGGTSLTAVRATACANLNVHAQPVIIGPGQSAVVHMWWLTAATTAATFEFDIGWWEF